MLSTIRTLEYEKISNLDINGKILDLGGSKRSGYHELIKGTHDIITVNIDPKYECDLIFDIQEQFPVESDSIDHVLLFNVLEHVYMFENVILESSRVLKKRGYLYMATPFIFQIHGSPSDFFRYSKHALENLFLNNNFEIINIEELGYGFLSLAYELFFIRIIPSIFLKKIFQKFCIYSDIIFLKLFRPYRRWSINNPMGYWVCARRR